jgi:uncharacterized Tic20 family protein
MENSMAQSEERTWAMMAHLSSVLNLFAVAFGGVIASGVIWLLYKEKSKKVAFHALQSFALQAAVMLFIIVVVGGIWVVGFIFSFATVGFGTLIAVPVMILSFFLAAALIIAEVVYAAYAAYKVSNGEDFRYMWFGNWAARHV